MLREISICVNEEGHEYDVVQSELRLPLIDGILSVGKATTPIKSAWALINKLMDKKKSCKVHNILHASGIFDESASVGAIITRAKKLTLLAKQYQNQITEEWRLLVDWQYVFSYQFEKPKPEFSELESWLSQARYDTDVFQACFRKGLDTFFRECPSRNNKQISLDDFIQRRYLWATNGASYYGKHVDIGNFQSRKNKWVWAYSESNERLKTLIHDARPGIIRPFIKQDEPLKTRYIATSDDITYLQQAYISTFFEDSLIDHPNTTLFSSNRDYVAKMLLLDAAKQNNQVNLDVDQTSFDHHVTKWQVMAIVEYICRWAITNAKPAFKSELEGVCAQHLIRFRNQVVITENGVLPWNNGVASGWRWTAIIDTIANWCQNFAVHMIAGVPVSKIHYVQGDDSTEIVATRDDGLKCLAVWLALGYEVAPQKTLLSTSNGEYLRYTYGQGLRGYPLRAIKGYFSQRKESTKLECLDT